MNSNNKIVKSSNTPKFVKPLVLVILIILACFAGYKVYANYRKEPAVAVVSGPTAEEKQQAAKVDADNKKMMEGTDTPSSEAEQPPSSTTPTSYSDTMEITAKQETNSTVTIIAKLPGVSAGNCSLAITNGSKSINKSAVVIYQPEFSTCAGFSVPISDLGAGTWNISISLSGSTSTGSKTISLKVN